MTSHSPHTTRELDRRAVDGIEVRMLWREHDDKVIVAVQDLKTGDDFSIELRDGERALDVFHHPYAYAAWRGIDTRPSGKRQAVTALAP